MPIDPPADRMTQTLLTAADQGSAKAAAHLTQGQQRMAHLLADTASGRLLFCRAYGWLTWTGTHWAPDEGVAARNELFSLLRRASRDADPKTVKAANSCMNDGPQRGVLSIAAHLPEFYTTIDQLDQDPYLLNLANGTYDLHAGQLRAHSPDDRLTKIARASYDPTAVGPVWDDHLEYFQPSLDVREFLQRFFGYSLLGKVTEHVLLICYGAKGANGKGTMDRIIQHTLGDYATTANQNLLVATRANSADAPSPARFALLGRRYVGMSETEKRAPIAEALMKNLTGGDIVSARALHKDEITFAPSHTLCLFTNHKPKLSGDDSAVWRRVKLVPFDISRPKAEQDTTIDDQLKLETDYVLMWMLKGYHAWTQQGLDAPASVEAATSEYQYEEDSTSQFIDEHLVPSATELTPTREVWDAYERFVRETQAVAITPKELYQHMENAGYSRVRRSSGHMFKGVALRMEVTTPSPEMLDEEPVLN